MDWKRLLNKFREWLDGDLEMVHSEEPRKVTKWEELYLGIARELDQVMQRELFRVPNGPTLVPREYLIFLKPEVNKEWQGEKRKALSKGLKNACWERAKELTGDSTLLEKSFTVKLRSDATLQESLFRIQHVWDPDEETVMGGNTAVRCFSVLVQRPAPRAEIISPILIPAYKNEIIIGRGSSEERPDLVLAGDREVSRKHAALVKLVNGKFKITCYSTNPIRLKEEQKLCQDESTELQIGDTFGIGSYELVIQ